ncbi:MAG: phosphate ABC transporter permease PstA [Gammaproteobacteria bacterium]|nr:phosphate ABC transporter permease PstA [Gammaproteobacteria bacterium]NNF50708.1 phosphate ABC transporter permease PstA [Woeseiaceae bacterium]MBT8093970.1 phosphate ABC transporter permease PstA [Gammaproteobacteria bacterium]MBT8104344.1 phosphate ABC transporter permease PstA [Gammaproteobacteria bacterium]NNK24360.1 phosphate ABC transporter permease PstA [Woeseiaceae bacterium]
MDKGLTTRQKVEAGLARRRRKEYTFRALGALATAVGVIFLAVFFASLIGNGASAFQQTFMLLDVELKEDVLAPGGELDLQYADFDGLVRSALRDVVPGVSDRSERRALYRLVSTGAGYQLRDLVVADPSLVGTTQTVWVPAASNVDMLVKGNIDRNLDESLRPLSDKQIGWVDVLDQQGRLESRFNRALFTNGDSRDPELAGIKGAVMGSFYMLLVTVALSFPIGVAAAIYLEEFAPKSRLSDLIEVNINNLAAVPSIVFGLLGLAVFINWMALPRSAPLVGGLVLTLLTLPVIIIASRAAIKAVPPSIREAALGLGASQMQVVFHHVLPLALPGMLTGTIIGMSRALGESAPLLMIGMVAFIVDVPGSFSDPATALPVQVYLWADSPERAFAERTSAAIIVLLGFLLLMNLTAVILRKRMERKW